MMRRLLAAGIALLVLAAGTVSFAWFYRPPAGRRVEVTIPSGATTTQVAQILHGRGVIGSTLLFRLLAKVRGLDGRIEAGKYDMAAGIGAQGALDAIARGPVVEGTFVAIPPGFNLRQIAARYGARTDIPEASLLSAATDGSVRHAIEPPGVKSLEGLLFPDTYFVADGETAAQAVRRMLAEFDRRTSAIDWSLPRTRGLSRYQAVIVASLVEREAKLAEDRPKVAAVIYNRLKRHMRLQIDITALYGLDEHKVPTPRDLRRPSPYNTYLIDGLPPTPIASPGLDAIRAAVHPASIDALYYVVIDPSGREGFTSDPREFERMKSKRPAEVH